jgi:hypothetical protein
MTRKWYTPDPEPDCNNETGYTTVTYSKPMTEEERVERRKRAAAREEELDIIMSHPMTRFKYEREQKIEQTVKRLMKDPQNSKKTAKQLYQYVRGYLGNEGEPVIFIKPKTSEQILEEKKIFKQKRQNDKREREIERNAEMGIFEIKEFDADFIASITKTRTQRKLSQKDLAMIVNQSERDIRDLEAGNLPFNGGLKSLLIWKLGLN